LSVFGRRALPPLNSGGTFAKTSTSAPPMLRAGGTLWKILVRPDDPGRKLVGPRDDPGTMAGQFVVLSPCVRRPSSSLLHRAKDGPWCPRPSAASGDVFFGAEIAQGCPAETRVPGIPHSPPGPRTLVVHTPATGNRHNPPPGCHTTTPLPSRPETGGRKWSVLVCHPVRQAVHLRVYACCLRFDLTVEPDVTTGARGHCTQPRRGVLG